MTQCVLVLHRNVQCQCCFLSNAACIFNFWPINTDGHRTDIYERKPDKEFVLERTLCIFLHCMENDIEGIYKLYSISQAKLCMMSG